MSFSIKFSFCLFLKNIYLFVIWKTEIQERGGQRESWKRMLPFTTVFPTQLQQLRPDQIKSRKLGLPRGIHMCGRHPPCSHTWLKSTSACSQIEKNSRSHSSTAGFTSWVPSEIRFPLGYEWSFYLCWDLFTAAQLFCVQVSLSLACSFLFPRIAPFLLLLC